MKEWLKMVRCPECSNKMRAYCSKLKKGRRIRYYKCNICGNSVQTLTTKVEIEKIVNKNVDK